MRKPKRQFPGATAYRDRHGTRRWRYRAKGFSAELGTDYGSPDFVARYEAAQKQQKVEGHIGQDRTRPGSISALVASFYASPQYRALEPSTRKVYWRVIEKFRAEHGDKRAAHLERRHVMEIIAKRSDTPGAANFLLRMIRQLLDHAIDLEWRTDNPARLVKSYVMPEGGWHTWTEDEIARFYGFHQPGGIAHLAMTLMLYTGAARSDAVKLGWASIEGDRLTYRRKKTRKQSGVVVNIPIHPDLAAVLTTVPRDHFTFLQTAQGKSRSPNGLGNLMREWCDAAGLPKCTSHGLRKACARRLAEAGATPHEIMAVTGHKTLKEVERYAAAAGRARLADTGFDKLSAWSEQEQVLTNHPARFVKSHRK